MTLDRNSPLLEAVSSLSKMAEVKLEADDDASNDTGSLNGSVSSPPSPSKEVLQSLTTLANEASKQKPSHGKARKSKGKDSRLCGVCGDHALGCNFDAISCESCKAFFRRNALKEKQPKCLFQGNCKIDVHTRRFCPHCRLKKCFECGMRKDLILRDDERKKRQAKVLQNREKKQSKGSSSQGAGVNLDEAPATPLYDPIQSPQAPSPQIAGPATPGTPGIPPGMLDPPCSPNTSSNLIIWSHLMKMPTIDDSYSANAEHVPERRELTPEETMLLTDLQEAFDQAFDVKSEQGDDGHRFLTLNQLVNRSSLTVLRLIKFAKKLEDFVRLSQDCQIKILKAAVLSALLLRSTAAYDMERDGWITANGGLIPTAILKNATGFVQLHEDHVQYCRSMKAIIHNDRRCVALLLAITLFTANGLNVVCRDIVANIQDKYLILLKHYLEAEYSYSGSQDMYPVLLSKLAELRNLSDNHAKFLLDVNPSEIEPIMLEVFDLK